MNLVAFFDHRLHPYHLQSLDCHTTKIHIDKIQIGIFEHLH
jgi:hypothetical protein